MLYREPKLLKARVGERAVWVGEGVSVLYREPKLLKVVLADRMVDGEFGFSALP